METKRYFPQYFSLKKNFYAHPIYRGNTKNSNELFCSLMPWLVPNQNIEDDDPEEENITTVTEKLIKALYDSE